MADKKEEKEKTPLEKFLEATGADKQDLIDRAVFASMQQKWVPDGEK